MKIKKSVLKELIKESLNESQLNESADNNQKRIIAEIKEMLEGAWKNRESFNPLSCWKLVEKLEKTL